MVGKISKEKCCGCGICELKCPLGCISMKADAEGFLYPLVDRERCTECGLCERVCPSLNYNEPECQVKNVAYVARYNDDDREAVLGNCTSGGAYTAFAKQILSTGGVACGATYKNAGVTHTCVSKAEDFRRHSTSKYVQSDIRQVCREIKDYLEKNKIRVLFSGTPCQIVALKQYLGKDYQNLICVDLVCAGVSSPAVFREYISMQQAKQKSIVDEVNFRKKTYGYHSSTMYVHYQNGKSQERSRFTDEMMRLFTSHICDRPSCASCVFKGADRYSDLTIFDCWHYKTFTGKEDDDRGYTSILVHTEKGRSFLDECQTILSVESVEAKQLIEKDGNMVFASQEPHKLRNIFWETYQSKGLTCAIDAAVPITFRDRFCEASKKVMYKYKLLNAAKRILYRGGWNY